MNIRNIGIFAHVDAGKTTLTEQMLFASGAIRSMGRVDDGTAHTDRLEIERRRGISVKSACARLEWRGVTINIIDTPGHMDFASEVERSMWALDGAVLVISSPDGVRPHDRALFEALTKAGIPVVLFINKTDRLAGGEAISVARRKLSPQIAEWSDDEALMGAIAEENGAALESYVAGEVYERVRLESEFAELSRQGKAFAAVCGSALRGIGVEGLLDAIVLLLPPPKLGDALSGVIFAVSDDASLGRAAWIRLFGGQLRVRVPVDDLPGQPKITSLRDISASGRGGDLTELNAGEIGVAYGLGDVMAGQTIGVKPERKIDMPRPVYTSRITAPDVDPRALNAALAKLHSEDPALEINKYGEWLHVNLMGAIQTEVLKDELKERFGIDVEFGPPKVIYRETIKTATAGFVAYTMPKPCWAVIKFWLEPAPRGSGVTYSSTVPVRDIMDRYQHQIEQALPNALRQGMLGWQVDDVIITLIGGGHHLIHTHPLDFIVATPMALMDGLRRAGSVLLEPIMEMKITSPNECAGKLLTEIANMRGRIIETRSGEDGMMETVAYIPAAESADFLPRLSSMTNGRGEMISSLHGYEECPEGVVETCPRRGVNPLDTAKYILAARNALDGGIFD